MIRHDSSTLVARIGALSRLGIGDESARRVFSRDPLFGMGGRPREWRETLEVDPLIQCKTCDTGELQKKRLYRMSGIVVFIGYVILLPSILGALAGVAVLAAGIATTSVAVATDDSDQSRSRMRDELRDAGIPISIVNRVLRNEPIRNGDRDQLSPEQIAIVETTQARALGESVGSGVVAGAGILAGGAGIFITVSSLVGGLIGWLLIMKKSVLQCDSCAATTATS